MRWQQSSSFSLLTFIFAQRTIHMSAYRHINKSVSVCVSDSRKSLRLKNVATQGSTHTSESPWRLCALGSRRVEESRKAFSSPSARAIFMHTWTSASTYCLAHNSNYPCDGACSARASRLPIFSRRGSEEKKHLRFFLFFDLFEFSICRTIYHFH